MRRGLRGICLLGALMSGAACGEVSSELESPPLVIGKQFKYPLDEQLQLQHVQVRGTHNSYHIDTHDGSIEPWEYTHAPIYEQLDRLQIRQLELDVSYDAQDGLTVVHIPFVDTGTRCTRLLDCLREVRRFSDAYPGHLPIYVQIEPKNDTPSDELETFFGHLEAEILTAFPRQRVITPAEVQGDSVTLRDALKQRGWPVLGRLRGRVLFAFDTTGPVRTAYTHNKTDLRGRLLFVDSAPEDPFGAVSVLNDPKSVAGQAQIRKAVQSNFLVRTRADADTQEARAADTSRGQAALLSAAHFISTDFPEPTSKFSYRFEVPTGKPARCNPLVAPLNCTPLALEDPAFVGSAESK